MRRDTASYTIWSSGLAMTVVTTNTYWNQHWQTAPEYYVHINVQIVLLEPFVAWFYIKLGSVIDVAFWLVMILSLVTLQKFLASLLVVAATSNISC